MGAREDALALVADAVDETRGLVDRKIFVDEAVYRLELERVFGRAWLFLAHETQIEKPGDFLVVKMGETPVIVCRDHDNEIRALINSCRHRGNPVVRVDAGNAATFTCNYHGWCYNIGGRRHASGALINLPGVSTYYKNKLPRETWGLVPVAQVDSYKGLIFGTFDPEAPPLPDFLGDMRWALDIVMDKGENLRAVRGIARWQMECNWKFAADNAIGDTAHAQIAHRSALKLFERAGAKAAPLGAEQVGFTMATRYGHGLNADYSAVGGFPGSDAPFPPDVAQRLGDVRSRVRRYNMNVFPNLFLLGPGRLFMVRNPLGPTRTEIRGLVLYNENDPPELQAFCRQQAFNTFGPAGLLEQEDGENWDQATVGAALQPTQCDPLNYTMGLGAYPMIDDGENPPHIESVENEYAQRVFYRTWADMVSADDWETLRQKQMSLAAIR